VTGLTLTQAAALTGLSVDEIQRLVQDGLIVGAYTELGRGEPHMRILPRGLKGIGRVPFDPAPSTAQDTAAERLIDHLRRDGVRARTVGELSTASGLNRAATDVALVVLRALGLVERVAAPEKSGSRRLWRWIGASANGPVSPQEPL